MRPSDQIRRVKGERSPSAKLSLAQMLAVRARYDSGEATQAEMAVEFGVTRQAIFRIVNRLTWRSF